MENTREKNKRADGRKKTYFDRENKKKAVRIEKTKSVAPEKGKQKKSSSSSKCPYQKKCGGCTYLNLSYEEQLAKKEQFLKKTLKGILPEGGIRHTAHVEQLAFFTVDNPPFSVPLLLLYKKNSIISPHAKDFIDMVKEYYRNLEANKIKE